MIACKAVHCTFLFAYVRRGRKIEARCTLVYFLHARKHTRNYVEGIYYSSAVKTTVQGRHVAFRYIFTHVESIPPLYGQQHCCSNEQIRTAGHNLLDLIHRRGTCRRRYVPCLHISIERKRTTLHSLLASRIMFSNVENVRVATSQDEDPCTRTRLFVGRIRNRYCTVLWKGCRRCMTYRSQGTTRHAFDTSSSLIFESMEAGILSARSGLVR